MIKRSGAYGGILHEVVEHDGVLHLAGIVAEDKRLDMAGQMREVLQQLDRVLAPLSGSTEAGLIGRPERLDRASAAFVNAVAGNLMDYDDTHLATVIHPTAPAWPAALALAEALGRTGEEALLAFVLGGEVE